MDQASTLRQMVGGAQEPERLPARPAGSMRVISVTSGKGGVGKTNMVINLCMALARLNKRVFLLDADMGLANVDVILGISPKYTLEHLMRGERRIEDVVMDGPGFRLLPSSSGLTELADMTYDQQMFLFRELSRLDEHLDYLFIDTGAGIHSNVLRFNASAGEVLIIATPEPTSITDAYALMKLLALKYNIQEFTLLANMVTSDKEGQEVYNRLAHVCQHFLNVTLNYLGCVPQDPHLRQSVRQQQPLLELFPASPAAKSITRLAGQLNSRQTTAYAANQNNAASNGKNTFWDRLLHWKKM